MFRLISTTFYTSTLLSHSPISLSSLSVMIVISVLLTAHQNNIKSAGEHTDATYSVCVSSRWRRIGFLEVILIALHVHHDFIVQT